MIIYFYVLIVTNDIIFHLPAVHSATDGRIKRQSTESSFRSDCQLKSLSIYTVVTGIFCELKGIHDKSYDKTV